MGIGRNTNQVPVLHQREALRRPGAVVSERRFIAIGQTPTSDHPWIAATYTWLQRKGEPFTAVDVAEQMLLHYERYVARSRTGRIRRQDVIDLYDAGNSQEEIARILGCNRTAVRHHLRKAQEAA